MKIISTTTIITFVFFIIVTLTWGTTWMAMKIAVQTIPPIFATGLRFLCAAPVLMLLAKWRGEPLMFPQGKRRFQIILTLCYFAIPFTLMIYGEKTVSSGIASLIFSTMPVMVLVLSVIFLRYQTSLLQIIGVVLSLASLAGILLNESLSSSTQMSWQGMTALIVAVLMHASMYVQCNKRCLGVSVLTFNALPCLLAGCLLLILGGATEPVEFEQFSQLSLLAVLYLGVIAGVLGIASYFVLQQRATPFQASLVFLIFPLVALSIERALTGHSIERHSLLLLVPLFFGISITLLGKLDWRRNKSVRGSIVDKQQQA